MANLEKFIIKGNEWKNISDSITLEDNKTYSCQILNSASIASSSGEPKSGFYINTPNVFTYTKREGEDLWVKSSYYAVLVIAD